LEVLLLLDLHVHSSHTPGVPLSVSDLADRIKALGFDGFCLTDFHTVAGTEEANKIASKLGLTILVGFEAATDHGHFLAFVPDPETLPEIGPWLRQDDGGNIAFVSLQEAVEKRNGVLVAAHPFDRAVQNSPRDGLYALRGVSAVEVLNARKDLISNELAEELAAGFGLPGTGGSDARHHLDEIGTAATLVHGRVQSESDLIDRIRQGEVWPVQIGTLSEMKRSPSSRRDNSHESKRGRSREDSDPRRRDGKRPNARGLRTGGDRPRKSTRGGEKRERKRSRSS
jgi:predicted metal-dependent phosphoesterase TrpH